MASAYLETPCQAFLVSISWIFLSVLIDAQLIIFVVSVCIFEWLGVGLSKELDDSLYISFGLSEGLDAPDLDGTPVCLNSLN
ncbi:unnamed protein product [Fusarium venenatum]|uniref:Uncharacterized protein n=1 Tax=Fusarium venenatum TaxID=56646 RepID=A0A2L2TGV0_9HYPO|nr:uncharacterized protein FVRRES_01153 [Fusarium venenatum]CEI64641.1 unnamed protein product [Fusarium venenatum]